MLCRALMSNCSNARLTALHYIYTFYYKQLKYSDVVQQGRHFSGVISKDSEFSIILFCAFDRISAMSFAASIRRSVTKAGLSRMALPIWGKLNNLRTETNQLGGLGLPLGLDDSRLLLLLSL